MAAFQNSTDHLATYMVARDAAGLWQLTTIIKATFTWDRDGRLVAVPPLPLPAGAADPVEGGPQRPRVDIILSGEVRTARPVEQRVAVLAVGSRLRKEVRVFGERRWIPLAGGDLAPSRALPATHAAIAWTSSFGGTDADDPTCIERRNPVGSGIARTARSLEGRSAPRFEAPAIPVTSWQQRPGPAPIGFGAIQAHWEPRIAFAGTYDERWRETRWPLLPLDFDPVFFNAAPVDQQLDDYRAGEMVTLTQMTGALEDGFRLPELEVPVTVFTTQDRVDCRARIDTVVIEPGARRVSVIARAGAPLRPTAAGLRRIIVGAPGERA